MPLAEDAGCWFLDAGYNVEYTIFCGSRIKVSSIEHQVSCIEHQVSCISLLNETNAYLLAIPSLDAVFSERELSVILSNAFSSGSISRVTMTLSPACKPVAT